MDWGSATELARLPADDYARAAHLCMKAPVRWLGPNRNASSSGPRDFWALRGVSFEMRRAKWWSDRPEWRRKIHFAEDSRRVTQPTEGHAEIHGRVGSLLEVGTGFHPELTGRENTYLMARSSAWGKRNRPKI